MPQNRMSGSLGRAHQRLNENPYLSQIDEGNLKAIKGHFGF